MIRASIRIELAGVGLAGPLVTLPALAQTADKGAAAGGLEEVVVTATRRAERLQDVPISVTAFSQEKLDTQGLRNIDDLTRLSPGIAFSRNGAGSSANYNDETSDINIRGVDSTAGASTVGVYVDDTPIQGRHIGFGAVNAFPALFDLDRVEVLRGPQGTLFGAGSEGGAVRFITPDPGLKEQTGYVRAELGTTKGGDPSYEAGVATGGPLIDDVLGFRISASFRRDGGWVDRVSYTRAAGALPSDPTTTYAGNVDKAANYQQTMTARLALTWKPADNIKITPSLYYQRLFVNDTASYWTSLSDPNAGVFRNGNAGPNPSTDPFYLGAVKVDWDLGFADLISNTSYLSRDQHSVSDYTQYLRATYLANSYPPGGDRGSAVFGDIQRNFYQEFRLASSDKAARLTWNLGLFYSHLNENVTENIYDQTISGEFNAASGAPICSPTDTPCVQQGLISFNPENRVIDKQLAAFGEVAFKLTDTLSATVGVRVSKVDYTGTIYNGGPFVGELIQNNVSASEKPVTPKAVLSWKPDADNLYYVSASKGYRVGGINAGVGQNCDQDAQSLGLPVDAGGRRIYPKDFQSDSLWSYELGAKNAFLDRRLQINTSVFQIDWKNIQQNVYLPHCGEQYAANLGQVKSIGGDVEFIYKPIDPLLLNVTAAYVDARYTKDSTAGSLGTVVRKGDRLLGAPWSFTTSAEYKFADWAGRTPYVRLDYQYQTAQTALLSGQNANNALFDQTIPGLPVVRNLSLRGGFRFAGFDLSLYAQNLTNAHPTLFKSRDIAADFDQLYFARGVRPRTIGITGTYRY